MKDAGFKGFIPVSQLRDGALNMIPDVSGVYMVLRVSDEAPVFLEKGSGGHFKGKEPNVPVDVLKANWVKETPVSAFRSGQAGRTLGWKIHLAASRCFAAPVLLDACRWRY